MDRIHGFAQLIQRAQELNDKALLDALDAVIRPAPLAPLGDGAGVVRTAQELANQISENGGNRPQTIEAQNALLFRLVVLLDNFNQYMGIDRTNNLEHELSRALGIIGRIYGGCIDSEIFNCGFIAADIEIMAERAGGSIAERVSSVRRATESNRSTFNQVPA